MTKLKLLAAAAACALAVPAAAATLIDVVNQTGTFHYDFTVTAQNGATDFAFAGYNLPSFIGITNIGVFSSADPATNLLGSAWTYTPAPSGADSYTGGNFVPDLYFGSVVTGSYDTYDQVVATTAGSSYHVVFDYSNRANPSGFRATTSASTAPEPATWALMIGGFGLVGASLRRRSVALAA
ncbi:MAG: PEP-CTERM sorting domain-containing protein [Sphingomonadaceae bacterium]|nr:PEP-CTERM sorting domain-containing protein [Sphingomonadaceae bacterium]